MENQIIGTNNKIFIIENGNVQLVDNRTKIPGLHIKITGDNNIIKIFQPIRIKNSLIEIGNNNVLIELGPSRVFKNVYIRCCWGNNQFCKIKRNTTIIGVKIYLDEESSCIIGEDCMLSDDINIWPTDGHAILDNDTGEILNTASEPIVIGNHVWIGQGARITKNARIGNNCIIGGGTVACKDYKEDNVIIAGNPGKIIKRNITWDRRNPYHLQLARDNESK